LFIKPTRRNCFLFLFSGILPFALDFWLVVVLNVYMVNETNTGKGFTMSKYTVLMDINFIDVEADSEGMAEEIVYQILGQIKENVIGSRMVIDWETHGVQEVI